MIVYGRQAVREALRGRRAVRRVFATESAARAGWLESMAVEVVPAARIEALAASHSARALRSLAQTLVTGRRPRSASRTGLRP